jgi:hypothetical protein
VAVGRIAKTSAKSWTGTQCLARVGTAGHTEGGQRVSVEDGAVVGLVTLQFASGGLFDLAPVDGYKVHLVRQTAHGTPGPTLCGVDRFAPNGAGWSIGGGVSGPGVTHEPCEGCARVRKGRFATLPVSGLGSAAHSPQIGGTEIG